MLFDFDLISTSPRIHLISSAVENPLIPLGLFSFGVIRHLYWPVEGTDVPQNKDGTFPCFPVILNFFFPNS